MEQNNNVVKEDEIDLVELGKVLWSRKWLVVKLAIVFAVIGAIVGLSTPNVYKTSCTLIPEAMSSGNNLKGSIGGLASLAGLDIGGMSNSGKSINPALYQSIARSTPFLQELMNQKFFFSELGKEVNLYEYYTEYYKLSLLQYVFAVPKLLLSVIRPAKDNIKSTTVPENLLALTKEEVGVAESLKSAVLVAMDWDLGVVRIEVEMQDPYVAAAVAQFTQQYITDYVISYSTKKIEEQLKFVEEQYLGASQAFESKQLALAGFRDKNINVSTSRARSEEQRLESEYNLAYNIYNQLAQQREQIKLQVKEETPVFTVLEPSLVPADKDGPKRLFILIAFAFIGGVVGVILAFFKSH